MLRARSVLDPSTTALFLSMAGLGVLLALLLERWGVAAALLIAAALASVVVVPASLREGLVRFGALRRQLRWWHALWLLTLMSGFVFRIRDQQAIEQGVDAAAVYRIGLVGIVAFILMVRLALRQTEWVGSLFRGLVGALCLFAAVSAVSTVWSVYPAWTLYKSVEYLVDVILIAAILVTARSEAAYKSLFDWTWTLCGLTLVVCWLEALVWPTEALRPSKGVISVQLNGVIPHVAINYVGQLSAIICIIALARLLLRPPGSGRAFYLAVLTFGMATMIIAQTRSAILGFLVGLALLLYLSKRIGSMVLLISAAILILGVAKAGAGARAYMLRGEDPELAMSLTGRTTWWEAGWHEIVKRPLTGSGAFTARFSVLSKIGDENTPTVHNTYIETAVGIGFIGVIPIVVLLVWMWKILIREARSQSCSPSHRQMAIEAVAILGILTCRSIFATTLVAHPDLESFAVLGYAELLRRRSTGTPVVSP
jgi:uncharacterized membrane protein